MGKGPPKKGGEKRDGNRMLEDGDDLKEGSKDGEQMTSKIEEYSAVNVRAAHIGAKIPM